MSAPKTRGRSLVPAVSPEAELPEGVDLDDVDRSLSTIVKAGRKSAYNPSFGALARKYYGQGARHIDFAKALGVSLQTLRNWRLRFPDFNDACETGRDIADLEVENAVFQSATGYSYDAVKIMTRSVGEGCSEIVEVPYREHMPPNVQAAIFWLKNRRPDRWREKVETVVETKPPAAPIDLSKLNTNERATLLLLLEKAEPEEG